MRILLVAIAIVWISGLIVCELSFFTTGFIPAKGLRRLIPMAVSGWRGGGKTYTIKWSGQDIRSSKEWGI